jgi:serine/threonine protein kinase
MHAVSLTNILHLRSVLLTMHIDVVHGDLRPENLLVFQDDDGKFVIKVTDFGYSTCMTASSETRLSKMHGSKPWNAPEIDGPDILLSFTQAKMTDLYSLGMLCLWIIFRDRLWEMCPPSPEGYDPFVGLRRRDIASIDRIKTDGRIRDFARRWIQTTPGLEENLQITLMRFLDSALSNTQDARHATVADIESLIGSQR